MLSGESRPALSTEDSRFPVFMDATAPEPTQELHGREALAPLFDNLNTSRAARAAARPTTSPTARPPSARS
ncbi:hypothetical protein ABTY61_06410 [Kitasatospora sp. NPDC096128]|uniref:hypothetical protein n=1 Tax=Kitasatospora sp. NPDC096128 TaxID=3155547 RepID=UPI0033268B2D